jgi:hypothetical protein
MKRSNKHRNNNILKYLRYFGNNLSGREKHAFEKGIMQDKFEEEAFDGLSQLSYDELRQDLSELEGRLKGKEHYKNILFLPVFRYAAAVLLLASVGTIIYMLSRSVEKTTQLAGNIKPDTAVQKALPFSAPDTTKKIVIAQQIRTHPTERQESEHFTAPIMPEEMKKESAAKNESMEIEEVTVIGYGSRADQEIMHEMPGTIQSDTSTNSELALKGKASGVSVTSGNEQSGSETKVYIRGLKSIDRESITIRGKVVSSSDEQPLPGVTVTLKGTSIGTISDVKGNFSLKVPAGNEPVLEFTYVGYATEEVTASDNQDIEVSMDEDLLALDEVVVVGYGVQKKTDQTGAISNVQLDESPEQAPLVIHPRPLDGMKDFRDYIKNNVHYNQLPPFDKSVTVKLQFAVDTQGDLSDITIIKGAGEAFDAEAIRLLKTGPKWTPATQDGRPVSYNVILKIRFEPIKSD